MTEDKKSMAEQKRLRQAEDGKRAMLDYEAEVAAVRVKTERLRLLRLARDAAAPKATPASPKKKKVAAAKAKPQPLADWMIDQQKDGRRD